MFYPQLPFNFQNTYTNLKGCATFRHISFGLSKILSSFSLDQKVAHKKETDTASSFQFHAISDNPSQNIGDYCEISQVNTMA
jgi:hypothetical protein